MWTRSPPDSQTPPGAPRTKATYAHDVQSIVLRLSPVQRQRVIDACGEAWTVIEDAPRSMWLDEPTFNALTEAIRVTLGDEGTRSLYRAVGRILVKNPAFQFAMEAMIRISGMTPHTLLRLAPRAREAVVRNAGKLTYRNVGDRAVRLRMVGFPPSTWRLGSTALMLAGNWEGIIDAAGATPSVLIDELDLEGGSCVFDIQWS